MSTEIHDTILTAIGATPVVKLNKLPNPDGAQILAKLEYYNPAGSIKDRIALTMIEDAERSGKLKPGGTVIEATSGNTGIGLAMVAAVKGYRCIIVMTDKQSPEKASLIKAYGAELVIVPASATPDSPEYNLNTAIRLQKEIPNSYLTYQDFNPVNPDTHYRFTGKELWEQCGGNIDVFVAGIGTGGTLSGIARFLKEQNPDIRAVGVEPEGSIFKAYKESGELVETAPNLMTGIGGDKIPGTVHFDYIDEIVSVADSDSFGTAGRITREEGILCGPSAGCAVFTAMNIAQSMPKDKTVVTLIPDTGQRYLSSLFSEDWMKEHGLQ